jgi:hypothetical protein
MRIVLNPAARTLSIKAWVTVGLPHAVSLGTPLMLASSEFPRFQPAPHVSNKLRSVQLGRDVCRCRIRDAGYRSGKRQRDGKESDPGLPYF